MTPARSTSGSVASASVVAALSDRSMHFSAAAVVTVWGLTQCTPSREHAWWCFLGMLNGAMLLALWLRAEATLTAASTKARARAIYGLKR